MRRDLLRAALRRRTAPVDAARREALEQELLSRFDARVPHALPHRSRWLRYASAVAVLTALLTATQVPAEYQVEVGQRVAVTLPGDSASRITGDEIAHALVATGSRLVEVRARKRLRPDGEAVLTVEVWGDWLATGAEAERRLRALPSLQGVRWTVEPVRGRLRDDVLGKVGHTLFHRAASAAELEAARREVLAELRRREGDAAKIDIGVERKEDGVQLRIQVEKRRDETLAP